MRVGYGYLSHHISHCHWLRGNVQPLHARPPPLPCSKHLIGKAFTPTTTTPLLKTNDKWYSCPPPPLPCSKQVMRGSRQAYKVRSLKFYLFISILTSPSLWAGETTWWGGTSPCHVTVLFWRGEEEPLLATSQSFFDVVRRIPPCRLFQRGKDNGRDYDHPIFNMARRVT